MVEHKTWAALVPNGTWYHLARILFSPRRLSRMHTHDFPEIFWIESGNALHEINGTREKLSSGDILFIRPSDCHQLHAADSDGFVMVNLAFPSSVWTDLMRRYREIRMLHASRMKMPGLLHLSSLQVRKLNEDVGRLANEPASRLAVEHLLQGIYLIVSSPQVSAMASALPDWLAYACQEIERPEHFFEGVPAFIRLCGRSPEHVARTCRTLLGKSPTDLVNAVRIANSARELRLGTRSILEIALENGFNNLAHFYELFRSFQGTTPRRYRLEYQRGIA